VWGIAFLVIAGSWYLWMFREHGWIVLTDFRQDQIDDRIAKANGSPIRDLPLVGLVFIGGVCLWWPLLEVVIKRAGKRSERFMPTRKGAILLGAWCAVYLLLASCVHRVNLRYQAVVSPMISVLLASSITVSLSEKLRRHLFRLLYCAATMILVAAKIYLLCGNHIRFLVCVALLLMMFACWWLRHLATPVITCCFIVPLLLAVLPISHHLTSGHSFEQIALRYIQNENLSDRRLIVFGKPSYASRIRVMSRGKQDVICERSTLAWNYRYQSSQKPGLMLIAGEKGPDIPLSGYQVIKIPNGYASVSVRQLVKSVASGESRRFLNEHRRFAKLAVLKQRPSPMAFEPMASQRISLGATPNGTN
jgi:hypothetical protein